MWHHTRYYIFFASILTLGIITPSAFANTALVNIIPGSGPSDHCAETNTCFTPSILHISPGDTVTWTNNDNVDHSVVNGMPYANQRGTIFDSGAISPGKIFSFTFYDPGTYIYSDKIDRWMVGKVIVEEIEPSCPGTQIFQNGTCWECSPAGFYRVPEFGAISGLVVLVSIIGVVVLSRTFMKS